MKLNFYSFIKKVNKATNLYLSQYSKEEVFKKELKDEIESLNICKNHLDRLYEDESDKNYLGPVPLSKSISHSNWHNLLYTIGNKEGMKILEIGSREVTGPSSSRKNFSKANYVGFDIYPGDNVDVVGDAHKLSSYFSIINDEDKFDLIYSAAVFEHFAMPWVVATEISKMLKIGGLVFVETHFSYTSHERPWHFFQFSDMGLKALFSPALGFECIEAGMSNPMIGRFSSLADDYLKEKKKLIGGLFCHSEFLGRKIRDVDDFDWDKIDLKDIVGETAYPSPL